MVNLDIYVDGSFEQNECKGGYVILNKGKPILARHIKINIAKFKSSRNVTGELFAAFTAVSDVVGMTKNTPITIRLFHDYNGIEFFVTGKWRCNKDISIYYNKMMNSLKALHPELILKFVKVKGHSGDKWNEVADVLASGSIPFETEGVMANMAVYNS